MSAPCLRSQLLPRRLTRYVSRVAISISQPGSQQSMSMNPEQTDPTLFAVYPRQLPELYRGVIALQRAFEVKMRYSLYMCVLMCV